MPILPVLSPPDVDDFGCNRSKSPSDLRVEVRLDTDSDRTMGSTYTSGSQIVGCVVIDSPRMISARCKCASRRLHSDCSVGETVVPQKAK
ncbi:unnamed protein product [Protopolystoma xenopodis]|uniref:Uncharacterized protein n=1 Tax=Protopolystoma xenopodis TaxID=117903 RepID=A0A3S5C2L0_9PLAT|nr:unnamed protein product [Protopolystoma xenopodis]